MARKPYEVVRSIRWTVFHIFLFAVAILYIYPFLWMVSGSLRTLGGFASAGLGLIPKKVVWHNYVEAWTEAEFSKYFLNTVLYSTVPTITSLLFSAMAGYALSIRTMPGRRTLIGLMLVMMFLPAGFTIIPVFMLIHRLGLVGSRLGVMLPGMWGSFMYALFFMGFYTSIESGAVSLRDAAVIDGCNFYQTFSNVMLPLGRPMFATLAILGFMGAWNSFFWPLVVTMGNEDMRPIMVGLFTFKGEHMIEWTLLLAGTTIALVPILLVFFFAQKQVVEGMAGAIKM